MAQKKSKSDKLLDEASKNFGDAIASPFKAVSQVFTERGSNRATKPTQTLIEGAASLFKGFVNLSASALADFTNPKKFKQKPGLTEKERSEQKKEAKKIHEQNFASLIYPDIPEKDDKEHKIPQPFTSHIASDGVSILPHQRFKCAHKYCEGDGYFIVTEGQLQDFANKGLSRPKSCYPCRLWVHNEILLGDRNINCEICNRPIFFRAKYRIFTHKNLGEPLASRRCNCKKIAQHNKQLSLYFRGNRGSIDKAIEGCEPDATTQRDKKNKFFKAKGQARIYARIKDNKPFDNELVNISDLRAPNSNDRPSNFYHNQIADESTGETRYEHIQMHVDGTKDNTMGKYGNAKGVIEYAHRIAKDRDPGRYLEVTEDAGKTHKKFDLTTGEIFIYNIQAEQAFLRTAYIPTNKDIEKRRKLGLQISKEDFIQAATQKFISDIANDRVSF